MEGSVDESPSRAGTPSTQEPDFVLRLRQPEIKGQGSGGIRQGSGTTAMHLEMLGQSHMGFSARLLRMSQGQVRSVAKAQFPGPWVGPRDHGLGQFQS